MPTGSRVHLGDAQEKQGKVESLVKAFEMLCLHVPPGVSVEAGMVAHTLMTRDLEGVFPARSRG